jgi:hypothetical protein
MRRPDIGRTSSPSSSRTTKKARDRLYSPRTSDNDNTTEDDVFKIRSATIGESQTHNIEERKKKD